MLLAAFHADMLLSMQSIKRVITQMWCDSPSPERCCIHVVA